MSDQPSASPTTAAGGATRKPWRKPELTLLPVEETENGGVSGTDGSGPFTGS